MIYVSIKGPIGRFRERGLPHEKITGSMLAASRSTSSHGCVSFCNLWLLAGVEWLPGAARQV